MNYSPNQNRGLPQRKWIKGGLSKLLEEFALAYREFSPQQIKWPSDEEMQNAIRKLFTDHPTVGSSAAFCAGINWLKEYQKKGE